MQVNFKYTSHDSLVFSFFVKAPQKSPRALLWTHKNKYFQGFLWPTLKPTLHKGAVTPGQQESHQHSHDVLNLDLEKFFSLTSCVDQSSVTQNDPKTKSKQFIMYRVNIDQRPLFISSWMNEGHPSLFPEMISSSLATAFNSKPNRGMEYKRGSFKDYKNIYTYQT